MLPERPTREQIIIGRLRKKVVRLVDRSDYWKAQYDLVKQMINLFPIIERRYKDHIEYSREQARVKQLEVRIKEQELLIKELTKDSP